MPPRLTEDLSIALARPGRAGEILRLLLILLVLIPVFFGSLFSFFYIRDLFTTLTLSRGAAFADLAQEGVTNRLDTVMSVGVSLATRVRLREEVEDGEWGNAIAVLEDVPENFAFIERILLADPSGTLKADTPHLESVVGEDFSFRDWYQGVSREWKPYLSGVYKRTAEPQDNVVAAAFPMQGDRGEVIGVLVLQMSLDTLSAWTRAANIGEDGGTLYIIDQYGQLVTHPDIPLQADVVDISESPVVRRALEGESGVLIEKNPFDDRDAVSAFRPIDPYGWGVVVSEPASSAFSARQSGLSFVAFIYTVFAIITLLLIYMALRSFGRVEERARSVARAMTESLRESEERYRNLIDLLPNAVFTLDTKANILSANKQALVLWGMADTREMVGRSSFDLIAGEDRERARKVLREALTKGTIRDVEFRGVRKDGTNFVFSMDASALANAHGKIIGIIALVEDVTKRREFEDTKTAFIALASHQLRTPLATISWYAETLLAQGKETLSIQQSEYLGEIHQSIGRMSLLVNALLDISQAGSGAFSIKPERVSVSRTLDECLKNTDAVSASKGLAVKAQVDPEVETIETDKKIFFIVLETLISNAVKYTSNKGSVSVTIEPIPMEHPILKEEQYAGVTDPTKRPLLITVSDTGWGIPHAEQHKIFTSFFRAKNVQEKETRGTGVGLYLAKLLLDRIGGTIWFESEENKGSTFHVVFPRVIEIASQNTSLHAESAS